MASQTSTELTQVEGSTFNPLHASVDSGKFRVKRFDFTQSGAGSAGDDQRLVKLPAGKVRVFLALSRIAHSAFGAARTLDTGWEAYTDQNGAAVAADPNGLDDGVDVSGAGNFNPVGTVGGDETYEFDSRDGVVIACQTNDAAIPDAATLKGYIVYTAE